MGLTLRDREYRTWPEDVSYELIDGEDGKGEYGKPETQILEGDTPVTVLDGVRIDWDALVEGLPAPE